MLDLRRPDRRPARRRTGRASERRAHRRSPPAARSVTYPRRTPPPHRSPQGPGLGREVRAGSRSTASRFVPPAGTPAARTTSAAGPLPGRWPARARASRFRPGRPPPPATRGSRSGAGRNAAGARSDGWDVLGRWTSGDRFTKRTSSPARTTTWPRSTSTPGWPRPPPARPRGRCRWSCTAGPARPLKVPTARRDQGGRPAGRPPRGGDLRARRRPRRRLDVPRYPQMTHQATTRSGGNGGEAWCSPTSTSMVLAATCSLRRRRSTTGRRSGTPTLRRPRRAVDVRPGLPGQQLAVQHRVAAPRVGHAFVTRLTSPRQAGRLSRPASPWCVDLVSAGAASPAPRSPRRTATCWSSSASPPLVDVGRQRPGRADLAGVAHLRPWSVRAGLAADLRRPGLRHPRRRAPAAEGQPGRLVPRRPGGPLTLVDQT